MAVSGSPLCDCPESTMTQPKLDKILLLILRLGSFFCFAGWTWVHFYWEGPYGVLLWQDTAYAVADQMGIGWDEFVGTGGDDGLIQKWVGRIGWLYLACTILTLTVKKGAWVQMALLFGGCGLLTILSYAKYLSAQRQLPMFIEHGGQMLVPALLVLALIFGVRHRTTITVAMVAVIMTFAGHGAYALGWIWPTPANFYGMTTVILHVEYETARSFLRIAGVLDFVICIGLFIPALRTPSAIYAAAWGFLTAIARPVAGMSTGLNYWGADQFIHEAVLRAPHYLIPLYLVFVWRYPKTSPTLDAPPEPSPKSAGLKFCHPSHNSDLLPDKSESKL